MPVVVLHDGIDEPAHARTMSFPRGTKRLRSHRRYHGL